MGMDTDKNGNGLDIKAYVHELADPYGNDKLHSFYPKIKNTQLKKTLAN